MTDESDLPMRFGRCTFNIVTVSETNRRSARRDEHAGHDLKQLCAQRRQCSVDIACLDAWTFLCGRMQVRPKQAVASDSDVEGAVVVTVCGSLRSFPLQSLFVPPS